jgi:c-di-GMP-binding flagellar brake protein YcgR
MPEQSRRVHERFEYVIDVTVLYEGREIAGKTVNISLGGLYMTTEQTLPFGVQAKVRLRLPALKEVAEVPVTIRWVTKEGLGVQFGSLRALEVWALNQLFKS